jgi:serine protease Do
MTSRPVLYLKNLNLTGPTQLILTLRFECARTFGLSLLLLVLSDGSNPPTAIGQLSFPSNPIALTNKGFAVTSLSSGAQVLSKRVQPAAAIGQTDDAKPYDSEKVDLFQIQQSVKQVLPKVLPCVVAIDGGSGVVVSSKGLILTASHVAGRAGRIVQVRFPDGRITQATTLGTNNSTDASALQINSPGPWPFLSLVKKSELRPGDWCLALGYPSSYPRNTQASLRVGRILKIEPHELTTDCLLMGGDSGGPLVNLQGDIIGINSRVKNRIDENFHIPSSVFIDEWNKIVKAYDVRERASPTGQRAYMGLNAETDSERIRIRKVHANSPAELAGLRLDDVILQFDGQRVVDFDEVLRVLDGRHPGEEVPLIVNRFGRLIKIYLVLGQPY